MDINAEVMNARLSSCRVYSQFIDAVCVMKFLFSSLFTASSRGGISIHLICFNKMELLQSQAQAKGFERNSMFET